MMKYAKETGLCPICRAKPRALWPDTGDLRTTCGDLICFYKWLPGKNTEEIAAIEAQRERDSLAGDGPVVAYRKKKPSWAT